MRVLFRKFGHTVSCMDHKFSAKTELANKNKTKKAVINIVSFRIFINLTFRVQYSTWIFKSDLKSDRWR